jgi:hypothetical protein
MKRLQQPLWILAGARLLVLAVVVVLLIQRCSTLLGSDGQGLPRGPVRIDQVKTHPEAHLFYPGAHLYWPISGGQQDNFVDGGTNFPFAGGILMSRDSSDAIYKWYADWLTTRGWAQYQNVSSTTWLSHMDFKRGTREFFTIAVEDPAALSRVLGTRVPTDRGTVFEVRYEIAPVTS